MKRFFVLFGVVLAAGLVACSGSTQPAVPTLPALATSGPASVPADVQQQVPAQEQSSGQDPLNQAVAIPEQLRGEATPLVPPWPTFTPGPAPESNHRLLYARTRRFFTTNADGSDIQEVTFANKPPSLLVSYYKDPGRGWLSPDGRYLVYFAGTEAQLWRADLRSMENVQLVDRMLSPASEAENEKIRALVEQEMAWSSDNSRVALVGAPDNIDVFIVNMSNNEISRVSQDTNQESTLRWSPDGHYLAYMSADPATGTQALYVVDTQTQQSRQVDVGPVREVMEASDTAGIAFTDLFGWLSDTQLVFYPHVDRKTAGIWLYDAASGTTSPILVERIGKIAWSPEAGAWVYNLQDEPGTLWLLRPGDSEPTKLVEGEAYAPIWSPDGKSILYSWSDPESTGWDLRVVDLNGNSRTLAKNVSLIETAPPEPGPEGKRYWTPDGQYVLFTTIGRDYGRAEQEEGYGGEAGPDLENWWMVSAAGGTPQQASDLQKVFYLQEPALSPDGKVWAYIGFSYTDRSQHLYTMPYGGGHPERVDAGVRWFRWLP